MQKPDNKLEILKQLYSNLSDECKQEFLRAIVEKSTDPHPHSDGEKVSLEEFLRTQKYENGRPSTCPLCGGMHIVKNGSTRGIARYL